MRGPLKNASIRGKKDLLVQLFLFKKIFYIFFSRFLEIKKRHARLYTSRVFEYDARRMALYSIIKRARGKYSHYIVHTLFYVFCSHPQPPPPFFSIKSQSRRTDNLTRDSINVARRCAPMRVTTLNTILSPLAFFFF